MADDQVWRFYTEQEIVNDMLSYGLSKDDKERLRALEGNQLHTLDDSLGKWVRSYYRLLECNNPYATDGAHRVSIRVIEQVWSVLSGKKMPAPDVVEEKVEPKQQDWIYFYNAH